MNERPENSGAQEFSDLKPSLTSLKNEEAKKSKMEDKKSKMLIFDYNIWLSTRIIKLSHV